MLGLSYAKDQFFFTIVSTFFTCLWLVHANCKQNEQFLGPGNKCLPCTICHPPLIVLATCELYKDTQCGSPHFVFGEPRDTSEHFQIIDEYPEKKKLKPKRTKKQKKEDFLKEQKRKFDKFPSEDDQKNMAPVMPKISNQIVNDFPSSRIHDQMNQAEQSEAKTDTGDKTVVDSPTFLSKYSTKLVISLVVGLLNAFLIAMLLALLILSCRKDRKRRNEVVQDLPHPTDTPVKCRFTAVLPSKSEAEYANVESSFDTQHPSRNYNSTLTSNEHNMHTLPLLRSSDHHVMDNGCGPQMYTEQNQSTPSLPPTTSSFSPQIGNMIENGLQYLRLPSPNPFTMDRLLENRRNDGAASTENNHYVETWCRSQSSFVRQPPSTMPRFWNPPPPNETSSPMMLRTYRSTPMNDDSTNKYNSLPS